MKIRNILKITGLFCVSMMIIMANTSLTIGNEITGNYSRPGFKPESDTCPYVGDGIKINDNFLYKKWCKETFDNGDYVYKAYKDVAFNIKYTPESAKTDFWQTPFETTKSKNGDCEDAVFLFFSHLLPNQENAEIVWGWVIDRRTGVARAHVWYQLKDKKGQLYVVEGFSNDWNGIMPMEIIKQTESREPIFTLSHSEASRLASIISKPDSWETYQLLADLHGSTDFITPEPDDKKIPERRYTRRHINSEFIEYQSMSRTYNTSWEFSVKHRINTIISKEISKIFRKLHEVFTRYEKQGKDNNASLQVAYGNINHFRRNLNCRR